MAQTRLTSYVFIILLLFIFLASSRVFDSREHEVQKTIQVCQSNTTVEHTEKGCKTILHCIISTSPPDYNARWGAAASILTSIPTIVGLMSNSIEEISTVAEESLSMAILLSLSSVTTFTSRFTQTRSASAFEFYPGYLDALRAQIVELLRKNGRKGHPFQGRLLLGIASVLVAMLGAITWYMLVLVTKFGVIVYACSSHFNILLWAGLSQLLTIVNLLLRRYTFETLVIPLNDNSRSALVGLLQKEWKKESPYITKDPIRGRLLADRIVLRCPSTTSLRWIIQTSVAVFEFMLYAFGTATLAGITLVSPIDAIWVMAVLTISAGFGRIVASWIMSSARPRKRSVVVDVPKRHMRGITEVFSKNGIKTAHHQDLDFGDRPLHLHWRLTARPTLPLSSPC